MHRHAYSTLFVALSAIGLLAGTTAGLACPFCSAPSLTLSEQLAQADATVLVEWVEGQQPEDDKPGKTVYEIRDVVSGSQGDLNAGDQITLARYRSGKKGDLFMLMGTRGTVIEWGSPLEVTETGYQYVAQSPSTETPTHKRLEYFMKFLEYPDQMVANDAYAEFANAPYKDITPLADKLPREQVSEWVRSKDTPPTRLGLYGLLLGLCGGDQDALVMEKKISEKSEDFRLGIDGVMSGYLLLKGAEGLDLIDELKLANKDVPFSETYSAMQALRFMWTYGEGRIEKERLRQSMRILLDRPELADLVIADLARWKDWSVRDHLMDLYDDEEYDIPSIKRAIVRYMLVCEKDKPKDEEADMPEHVVAAGEYLAQLRKQDPKTVKEAERFFFFN